MKHFKFEIDNNANYSKNILVDKIFLYYFYAIMRNGVAKEVKKYTLIRIGRSIELFSFFQATAVASRSLFDPKLI